MADNKRRYHKPKLTIDELSAALYVANEELKHKNEELVEMERSRSEMFANISHDLRSPITAIRSAIEYVSSLSILEKEELEKTFELITSRIISLESLINDIFLMTTLDNRAVDLNKEVVAIGPLLEEYFFSCGADVKYQARELILQVQESFDYPVMIDPLRIIRVLDNLFTNALKYSNQGDQIILGAEKLDHEILIWVRDTGIGIPSEYIDKIFERCFTVSSSRTPHSATGSGLGLSIAELIIQRHGGKIWCESELGKGSTFYFTLPIVTTQKDDLNG